MPRDFRTASKLNCGKAHCLPKYPVIFTKPADALVRPNTSTRVHPDAQGMLDYEGELKVVIKRDVKNLPASGEFSLSDYALGYTASNDVSARKFQLPDASGGQLCYAKSFDGFSPIGPSIVSLDVSLDVILDPQKLQYVTRVNGVQNQSTGTHDMIWSVEEILIHLTRGTTVRAGTVIMTGTPSGVGFF